jgi:hypothetical protein
MDSDMPDFDPAQVWVFDGREWYREPDPIEWSEPDGGSDEVTERYGAAGYSPAGRPAPFMSLGSGETADFGKVSLELWVRPHQPPECLIAVGGTDGSSHAVFAARLPDGLDLMARWASLVQVRADPLAKILGERVS